MVATKLFAALAVVLSLFAIILSRVGAPPAHFYEYSTYLVKDPTSFIKFWALACAIIAGTHFILGHVILSSSLIVESGMELFLREGQRLQRTDIVALFVANRALLFGLALFALGLIWALASIVFGTDRIRFSGHVGI